MSLYGSPINWLATTAYGVVCFLLGALFVLALLERRRPAKTPAVGVQGLDAQTSHYIDEEARAWARREGRSPAHADIAGSYAKLSASLLQGRDGERR